MTRRRRPAARPAVRRALVAALAAVALAAAGCGDDDVPAADRATTSTAAPGTTAGDGGPEVTVEDGGPASPAGGVAVEVAATDLGEVLVDGDGYALYLFTPDEGEGGTTCLDACAEAWPPLVGSVSPTAGEGVDAGLLDAFERPDGGLQASYGDWPLYRYAGDGAPGEVNGHGSGGVWFAVGPDGEPLPFDEGADSPY